MCSVGNQTGLRAGEACLAHVEKTSGVVTSGHSSKQGGPCPTTSRLGAGGFCHGEMKIVKPLETMPLYVVSLNCRCIIWRVKTLVFNATFSKLASQDCGWNYNILVVFLGVLRH